MSSTGCCYTVVLVKLTEHIANSAKCLSTAYNRTLLPVGPKTLDGILAEPVQMFLVEIQGNVLAPDTVSVCEPSL